ncbi:MAG: glycosyltransferase [Bacteroidetes bacterium HGW-Bacteroidetes-21]|jgi:dolichol-phosphate mannosyltransferase|nr:MAG: glycosyltransferase [Bacteroidetes bacterium HGW-Bacteroidetes-21]
MTLLSVIIPVYNEEELVVELVQRLQKSSLQVTETYELIFVNDASKDKTLSLLLEEHKKDGRVKVLNLSRNFGHQAAYTAGLNYSKGEYTVMLDGDLQDPPELIPEMYAKMKSSGADIVYGRRTDRKESLSKRAITWLFHKIFDRLSRNNQGDVGNFCLLNRIALDAFLKLNEKNRYLPGLRFFIGFNQDYVEYKRPDRSKGKAKMSFWKLVKLAFDAIFSFSKIPIRIALILGILGIIISLTGIGIVVYKKIIGVAITGWTSTMLSIYFLGSVQLLFLGILGEYIFRIYKETQNRPVYIVKEFWE